MTRREQRDDKIFFLPRKQQKNSFQVRGVRRKINRNKSVKHAGLFAPLQMLRRPERSAWGSPAPEEPRRTNGHESSHQQQTEGQPDVDLGFRDKQMRGILSS